MYRARKATDPEWRRRQLERLLNWLQQRARQP